MGRHNFDDGATQLICWGDTTPMLGRRNFGWGDITWGDKAMGRHNLHSTWRLSIKRCEFYQVTIDFETMISTSTKLFSFFFMRALVLLSQQFNLLFWYETVIEE